MFPVSSPKLAIQQVWHCTHSIYPCLTTTVCEMPFLLHWHLLLSVPHAPAIIELRTQMCVSQSKNVA